MDVIFIVYMFVLGMGLVDEFYLGCLLYFFLKTIPSKRMCQIWKNDKTCNWLLICL